MTIIWAMWLDITEIWSSVTSGHQQSYSTLFVLELTGIWKEHLHSSISYVWRTRIRVKLDKILDDDFLAPIIVHVNHAACLSRQAHLQVPLSSATHSFHPCNVRSPNSDPQRLSSKIIGNSPIQRIKRVPERPSPRHLPLRRARCQEPNATSNLAAKQQTTCLSEYRSTNS